MIRRTFRAALIAAVALAPFAAQAQGLVGGARAGYYEGGRQAGVVGAVVGGAVGAGVGTVNGALGLTPRVAVDYIPPAPAKRHRHKRHAAR